MTFPVNSARYALFTDPQILLFNNFFIKNGFHDTIYTFKNYFATVFFSFIFQFLAVFKRIQFERRKTLFSLTALFLNVYVLLLSFFLSSFACSHSRNSSRLHLVLTLWDFTSFSPCPNGRMASPFISSSFPSFLPFTLFTSSHNKCRTTYLDFTSTNFFSSALIGRMAFACFFSFVFSVSNTLWLTSH